jgi:hypothetical protein
MLGGELLGMLNELNDSVSDEKVRVDGSAENLAKSDNSENEIISEKRLARAL